ncbi:helix-turn-helix domain-containing protein [Paenibacillus sp. CAU 1782]
MKSVYSDSSSPATFLLVDISKLSPSSLPPRQPSLHHLLYIVSGNGSLNLSDGHPEGAEKRDAHSPQNAAVHSLYAGSCFMLTPDLHWTLEFPEENQLQGFVLAFDGIVLTGRQQPAGRLGREPFRFPYSGQVYHYEQPSIREQIQALYDSRAGSPSFSLYAWQRDFLQLLDHIRQQVDTIESDINASSLEEGPIDRTIRYMKEAYSRELTREHLADIAGMSAGYFSAAFRKQTGKSPMDMLAEIRIQRAKELLLCCTYPLRTIAQTVGFSTEFYFSSRFKQLTGFSPTEYVKRDRVRKLASSQLITTQLRRAGSRPVPEKSSERIVGLFLEDHLTALGVKPVLQYAWSGYYQRYLSPYLEDVDKLDVARIDFGRLRQAQPDRILLGFSHFASEGRYEQFAGIAPTIVFQDAHDNWRSMLTSLAQIIDREREAKEVIARYEAKAMEARSVLSRKIGGGTVALLRLHFRHGLCLYGGFAGYTSPVLYEDLRLAMPPLLQEWQRNGIQPVTPIAPEVLEQLDADYLFLIVDDGQAVLLEELLASKLWNSLRAVRSKRVFQGNTDVWMTFGIIAHERKIEFALSALN